MQGVVPSLDAVAAAAGVSKGGLLYHFDRQSLLEAIVTRAVRQAGERLVEAAQSGEVATTWLRMSVPSPREVGVYRALLSLTRLAAQSARGDLSALPVVRDAEQRWTSMLVAELGDPVRASVVRHLGDGLLWAAMFGQAPASDDVERIIEHLDLPRAPVRA